MLWVQVLFRWGCALICCNINKFFKIYVMGCCSLLLVYSFSSLNFVSPLFKCDSLWFSNQKKKLQFGKTKFCCVPGQIKMVPPIGPLLAQFLSSLASEFILFLGSFVEISNKLSFETQDLNLNSLSVKLFKFKSDELKLQLFFNVLQTLFNSDSLYEVLCFWKQSFELFYYSEFFNFNENQESFRLLLKNMLQLESYLFLLFNLYLFFCGWFASGFFLTEKASEILIFSKKKFTVTLPLFYFNFLFLIESPKCIFNFCNDDKLPFILFISLLSSVSFVYKGFSLVFKIKNVGLNNK